MNANILIAMLYGNYQEYKQGSIRLYTYILSMFLLTYLHIHYNVYVHIYEFTI